MNFLKLNWLPVIFIAFSMIVILVLMMEKRFFAFVKTYWFYKRSILSYFSTFLFLMGILGLLISLLDVRGPEEKIKTDVPRDRTIILVDTSASMLAEDVKPSRLQKAALIAKHFARKAAGHQLSIIAFAEIQKKIVPFTNDLDLIDARLDSLKNLRNHYGSSALTLAIQESIQYFQESENGARGNILVLTDGEETAESIDLKIPPEINVALVGVGTSMGGRIPLDDGRGFRFGYKKDRGQDVTTKLNEKYFKMLTSEIPSAKYWMTNSYSLPSEEILEFFSGEKEKGNNQQDMVIRPVLMEWIVVPSLILLMLAYFLKSLKILTLTLAFFFQPVMASEEPALTPEILERLSFLKEGKLNKVQKIKLADELQKAGAKEEALTLYSENMPEKIDKQIPPEAYLNYGTTLLEKGKPQEGLKIYKALGNSLKNSPGEKKIKEMMEKNIASYFYQQEQKKKEKKEGNNKQESKDKKQNESSSGQGKSSDGGKGQTNKENQPKPEDKKGEEEKKNEGEGPKDEQNQTPEKKNEKPQEDSNNLPKKIPAKLKQLMNDDRQLQMKMIESGTRDLNRRKSRKSKDW